MSGLSRLSALAPQLFLHSQGRPQPFHKLLLVECPLCVAFPILHPVGRAFQQDQFEWGTDFFEFSGILHRASIEFILGPLDEEHRGLAGSRVNLSRMALKVRAPSVTKEAS